MVSLINQTCSICMCDLLEGSAIKGHLYRIIKREGQEPVVMYSHRLIELASNKPSAHLFHAECIDTWTEVQKNCPVCKTDFSGNEMERSPRGALLLCISIGDLEGVKEISLKAALSIEDRGFALSLAAEHGHLNIAQELKDFSGDFLGIDKGEALMIAARNGQLDFVRALLTRFGDIDQKFRGFSAIGAAKCGHIEIVSELLAAGIDPLDRKLAAKAATKEGRVDIAKLFELEEPSCIVS